MKRARQRRSVTIVLHMNEGSTINITAAMQKDRTYLLVLHLTTHSWDNEKAFSLLGVEKTSPGKLSVKEPTRPMCGSRPSLRLALSRGKQWGILWPGDYLPNGFEDCFEMLAKYFTWLFASGWCAVLQRRLGTKRILSHFQRSGSRVWVTWSPFRPAVQESAVSDFLNLQ